MNLNLSQAVMVRFWLLKKKNHQNLICKTLLSHPRTPAATSCERVTRIFQGNMNIHTNIYRKIHRGPLFLKVS